MTSIPASKVARPTRSWPKPTERQASDTKWREGRVFSLVYKAPGSSGAAHDLS